MLELVGRFELVGSAPIVPTAGKSKTNPLPLLLTVQHVTRSRASVGRIGDEKESHSFSICIEYGHWQPLYPSPIASCKLPSMVHSIVCHRMPPSNDSLPQCNLDYLPRPSLCTPCSPMTPSHQKPTSPKPSSSQATTSQQAHPPCPQIHHSLLPSRTPAVL
jgi:hypothetical protein